MMRIYWRHFVCYMFFLTVLALHVFLRYAIIPEADLKADGYRAVVHEAATARCEECPNLVGGAPVAAAAAPNILNEGVLRFESRDLQHVNEVEPSVITRETQAQLTQQNGPPNMAAAAAAARAGGATGGDGNRTLLHPSANRWSNPEFIRYPFACFNIEEIGIKRKIGQGVTKQVYLGTHDGKKVAVKMVTRNVIDVMSCMKNMNRDALGGIIDKHKCYTLPNMKLMKEILLLHQLDHPNLLKLLGYCVRSEETESTSLQEHGVVAVYEYGLRFYVSSLRDWPWKLRLKTALELADLLDYLENSPLGSMRISDFKDAHFLLKDGRIKLTDLDDVTSLEPSCRPPRPGQPQLEPPRLCGYDLACIGGICPGYNARKNIDNFNQLFFKNLLFGDTYEMEAQLSKLRTRLDNFSITAGALKEFLYKLMDVPYIPGYS